MFESICTLPLSSELFTQDLHPTEPVLAVGLSAGHVQCFRLPPISQNTNGLVDSSSSSSSSPPVNGCGQIETQWRTRRHKGSCRTLGFSMDGDTLYSAGTDGLLKAASTDSGRVSCKILVPRDANDQIDAPTLLHVLTPQSLLVATDSSALHLFDLRANHSFATPNGRAQATFHPHDDYISSLTPLPPSAASTSGFSKQWLSTGGTTVAVTDVRRGVLVRSADQEQELLSSVFVAGFPKRGTSVGEKVVVGAGNGVLTLWERGVWDDQDERIVLDRGAAAEDGGGGGGESVDCLANVPAAVAGNGKMVAAGMGSGHVVCVQLGVNKVVDVFRHDEAEAVVHIGFDVGNRMISGGGAIIKVWQETMDFGDDDDEVAHDDANGTDKRALDSDDEDEDEDSSSAEDEKEQRKRRKKKKRKKGLQKNIAPGPGMGSFKGLD